MNQTNAGMNPNDFTYESIERLFRIAGPKLQDKNTLVDNLMSKLHGMPSKQATFQMQHENKPITVVLEYSVRNKGYSHVYEITRLNAEGKSDWVLSVDKK